MLDKQHIRMNMKKKRPEKYCVIIVCILVVMILIFPFLLEKILFNGPSISKFDNSEWFSFMGSYVGTIVAVIIMFFTIVYTEKSYKDTIKLQEKQKLVNRQIERIDKVLRVLQVSDYVLVENQTVLTDLFRFKRDFHSIQLDLVKLNKGTAKNSKIKELMEVINDLKDEQYQLIIEYDKLMQNKNNIYGLNVLTKIGKEITHSFEKKWARILSLYEEYIDDLDKKYYSFEELDKII